MRKLVFVALIALVVTACPEPKITNHEPGAANQNPVASDFIIGNLTQTVGNITPVTVQPKAGKSTGTITIFYNRSTALPTVVGTYTVTFNVAAVSGWNAVNGLSAGILTVNMRGNAQTPSITSQPTGAMVTVNALHSLSVVASVTDGGSLSYQWYSNTSTSNSGGTAIIGATSNIYNPPTSTVGIYYYFVEVTNTIYNNGSGGNKTASIRSDVVILTVNTKINAQTPTITSQPTSAMVTVNNSHSLSVAANVDDDGTLSYKWYSNTSMTNTGGTVITETTSTTFNPPTGTAGTFYYFVEVINTISDNGDGGVKTTSIRSSAVEIKVTSPSGIVINLEGLNEWELVELTAPAQINYGTYVPISFTVTGNNIMTSGNNIMTYRLYLDGMLDGTVTTDQTKGKVSFLHRFYKPAGVYQFTVVATNSSGESRSGSCRITMGK
jgi:hypothetical protein